MELFASRHKRSKSEKGTYEDRSSIFTAPRHLKVVTGCEESNQKRLENTEVQQSLKEEILRLQNQLKDQIIIRRELEKATINQSFSHYHVDEDSLTKPAKDLIKEISILEFEVKHLEKYLLSLYRKTFQKWESIFSTASNIKAYASSPSEEQSLTAGYSPDNRPKSIVPVSESEPIQDSYVHRSHSSLSFRTTPLERSVNEALESYHSLPLAMLESTKGDFLGIRAIEHLDGSVFDMSPNRLSEEMVKCISAVYCLIADPPLLIRGLPSSPMSFPSPRDQFDMWSPQCEGGETSFNSWVKGSMEFTGSYFTVVEVKGVCGNTRSADCKKRNFRSLVSRLERVDPRKLKHEEKLAFWINVHNALAMHAFLVYGTPRGTLKRVSLVVKAAYNVGGHIISVGDIRSTILGCRPPQPGQWLQSLLFPKPKNKSGDARKPYAIQHPQPLLYFALCSGSHSDPMVRVYTPKSVFQELEVAKEEYIHTNFGLHKGQKILLPKLVEIYVKESSLCLTGLMDMIEHSMPDCYRKRFHLIRKGKSSKKVEWVPHDFGFRYLLSPDLAKL